MQGCRAPELVAGRLPKWLGRLSAQHAGALLGELRSFPDQALVDRIVDQWQLLVSHTQQGLLQKTAHWRLLP